MYKKEIPKTKASCKSQHTVRNISIIETFMFGNIKATVSSSTPGSLFATNPVSSSAFRFPPPSTQASLFPTPVSTVQSTLFPSLFPAVPATTQSTFFSTLANPTTTAVGFPAPTLSTTTTSAPLFGTNLGSTFFGSVSNPLPQTTFTSFNTAVTGAPRPPATNVSDEIVKYILAINNPQIYGDERDLIIARFNQVLIFSGVGKGFYASNTPAVEFPPQNPFCQFKFVGYNRKLLCKDEDGFIGLLINKPEEDVKNNRQLLCDCLFQIMGSKPTISVQIESIKPAPGNKCYTVIYVVESNPSTGVKRRISASETFAFFNQNNIKVQLQTQALVENIEIKAGVMDDKLKEYLAVPPSGFDSTVWKQAQVDNPDPDRLVPWPIQGFSELLARHRLQVQETAFQENCTKVVIAEVLKYRRGHAVDKSEDALRVRLERINTNIRGPGRLKSKLLELLCRLRNSPDALNFASEIKPIGEETLMEIGKYMIAFQETLEKVITLIKKDLEDLENKIIKSSKKSYNVTPHCDAQREKYKNNTEDAVINVNKSEEIVIDKSTAEAMDNNNVTELKNSLSTKSGNTVTVDS
ncbi:Nuclear pore complex protein Nup54 [Trichinella nelsoni]|uniref:Nuclear pore complex protein Nup54 n=1 Tax=Trichinella nelsoni TaxID=6336 RepID=A0A0V0S6U1_9BILA|nr:Nuclear pore complex protein Nup54 [Trichinella nelsoni]